MCNVKIFLRMWRKLSYPSHVWFINSSLDFCAFQNNFPLKVGVLSRSTLCYYPFYYRAYLLCCNERSKNAYCSSICIMLMNMHINYSGRLSMWHCLHVSVTLLTKQRICWPMAHLSVSAERVPAAWLHARWKYTPYPLSNYKFGYNTS